MKIAFFTVCDQRNLPWAQALERSFKKFHKDIDFIIYGPDYCAEQQKADKEFFYRSCPMIGKQLLEKYDLVFRIDADSVVCGELSELWSDTSWDFGAPLNLNTRDARQFGSVGVWNINPEIYLNCGLVGMRSKPFVNHWLKLCTSPFFGQYRYREQDLMNILYFYGDYRGKCFDNINNKWWGLVSKDVWNGMELDENKNIVVRFLQNEKEVHRKIIKIIHYGGGNSPQKMEHELFFPKPVAERLRELTK